MPRYQNLSGDSGVVAYDIRPDSIVVYFREGHAYEYDHRTTGKANVEHMKALAVAGRGLSTFISQVVKERYARKLS